MNHHAAVSIFADKLSAKIDFYLKEIARAEDTRGFQITGSSLLKLIKVAIEGAKIEMEDECS